MTHALVVNRRTPFYVPATFFAGISLPVLEMYAKPALLRCFCNFLFDLGTFLSIPWSRAADNVAIVDCTRKWRGARRIREARRELTLAAARERGFDWMDRVCVETWAVCEWRNEQMSVELLPRGFLLFWNNGEFGFHFHVFWCGWGTCLCRITINKLAIRDGVIRVIATVLRLFFKRKNLRAEHKFISIFHCFHFSQ